MGAKKITILAGILFFLAIPTAHADVVNDQHAFFIDPQYDVKGRTQINATLRLISQHAYFYVSDEYWTALDVSSQEELRNFMQTLGQEFDNRIYPLENSFFGSEPNPGIDGDSHITFVLTTLRSNVGGYFDSTHEYSKSQISNSNEREMMFINTNQFSDIHRIYSFVAHELQHVISFNQKEKLRGVSDDIWLNELRSEYAVTLLGYNSNFSGSNLERRFQAFLEQPSDSLTEWKNVFIDYGEIGLFGQYIADRFSPRVIADTLGTSSIGILSVNEALAKNGFINTAFSDVFSSWMAANILNDPSSNPKFSYLNSGLQSFHVAPTKIISVNSESPVQIGFFAKDWEQRWYDIQGLVPGQKSSLFISFASPEVKSLSVAYVAFNIDGTLSYKLEHLTSDTKEIQIPNIGTVVTRVIVMPFQHTKISGFTDNEASTYLTMTARRGNPQDDIATNITPEQFGLHEGDFIRAEGDYNVYIINQFGYKRIVLSPKICLQYGHLGARGCFGAVHVVTPAVRDAFTTSSFYTNGETLDGKIYILVETGEDTAYLQRTFESIDSKKIFLINNLEQRSYPLFSSTNIII